MSEIPDDVYDAATEAMRAASEESQENVAWLFTLYCARAILAERERCAQIAEGQRQWDELVMQTGASAEMILEAIRSGEQQS